MFADGRLWSERTDFSGFERIIPRLDTQHFVDGSNWTDAASDSFRVVAIKSDGSLWSFQTYGGWAGVPLYPLTQIGSEKNWSRVAEGGDNFLLLKKDGTLWTWGMSRNKVDSSKLKKYLTMPPQSLDRGTNWTDVFSYGRHSGLFARKTDGSIWVKQWETNSAHLHQLESWQLPNEKFVSLASSIGVWTAGVKANGELWLVLYQENQKPKKIQLARDTKWKAAVAGEDSLIALRSDGTLWSWPSLWYLIQNPNTAKAVQLGNHSDWLALSEFDYWNSIALAADGSLWIWNAPSEHAWLAPSRKPVFVGNIFQGSVSQSE